MPTQEQAKKTWEREQLRRLMSSLGTNASDLTIEDSERPDFRIRLPEGRWIGVELTEILLPEQGSDRWQESRVARVFQDVLGAYLTENGGVGAFVLGHIHGVPIPGDDLTHLGRAFRAHLDQHGSGLAADGGTMRDSFNHEFGRIANVTRTDSLGGIETWGDGNAAPPAYRAPQIPEVLTTTIEDIVVRKAKKAAEYQRDLPLWLALRNPNQRMIGVPPTLQEAVRQSASGVFERVIVFNDRAGVVDPRPPPPRFLDLL